MKSFTKRKISVLIYSLLICFIFLIDPHKEFRIHTAFYFIELLICLFLIVSRQKMIEDNVNRIIILLCAIIVFIVGISGCRHYFSEESLFGELVRRGRSVTLLERTIEDVPAISDDIFLMYYFRDKQIILPSNEGDEIYKNFQNLFIGNDERYFNYQIIQKELDFVYSDDKFVEILNSYPSYVIQGNIVFVVDDGIKERDITFFKSGGKYYFCSLDLFSGRIPKGKYTAGDNIQAARRLIELISKEGRLLPGYMRFQILSVVFLMIIGSIIATPIWKGMGGWFVSCISLPIGGLVWTISGILLVIFHIKYCLLSQMLSLMLFLAFYVWKNRDHYHGFRFVNLLTCFIPLLLLLFFFSGTCRTMTSYDSIEKIQLGMMLTISNNPSQCFTEMGIYGMIEPLVHSMGFLLGGDYIYVLYPMYFSCLIDLFFYASLKTFFIKNKSGPFTQENVCAFLVLLFVGLTIMLSNIDVRMACYYVMSHGIVATYILMLTVFAVLKKNGSAEGFLAGYFLSALAIVITRTEGIIYVLFFLTIMIALIFDKEVYKVAMIIGAFCISWTVVQLLLFNGNDGEGYFFSPQKAIILIIGTVITITYFSLVYHGKMPFVLKKNYYLLYVVVLFIADLLLSVFYSPDLSIENLNVFISHMSNYMENGLRTNLGSVWIFILSFMPLLIVMDDDIGHYAVGTIIGYILLLYLIFLFRTNIPIRAGYGDSGRRLIAQMIPAAIFLVISSCSSIGNMSVKQSDFAKMKT